MNEKRKIVVADDDRRMVKTLCDILHVKGYEAIPAFSGAEAIARVKGEAPDCVLMDIRMPGVDGVKTLKLIREINPDLPIILMSAYATDAQVAEAKANGAETVLTKPIDLQQVLSFFSLLRKEKSVLIVDNDLDFSRTIKKILQTNGCRVATEEDPNKVLSHMEEEYQLVVLIDLKLGGADGVNVLKQVRARYPEKPVILLTSERHEMSMAIEQGMEVGAYTCLYKPFAMDNLMQIIKEISRRKRNVLLGEPFYSGVP